MAATADNREPDPRRGVVGRNSHRAAAWLAWSLWVLTVMLMALTLVLVFLDPLPEGPATGATNAIIPLLVVGSFSTVGATISSRRPENPIGWIFCAMGLAFVLAMFFGYYGQHGLVVSPGSLPGATTAAWAGTWIWPVVLSPVGFLLLLFPSVRPPSRRWRPVLWLLGAALVGWFVSQAFMPGPMANAGYESIPNPYGIETLGGVLKPLNAASGILLLVGVLASAVSLLVRFRRSRGDERRQLKWLAYAAVVVVLAAAVSLTVEGVAPDSDVAIIQVMQLTLVASLSLVPIAVGTAILKYRLYDIDVVINRTLVYGSLTAMLAAVHFGGVAATQAIFRALTGQEEQPQVAIVVSTLVIAALFNPLRRRIQRFIDRRFYRRKYDAVKTLSAFNARLRDETDLDALTDDLVGVVRETMQPAPVSLWLRPDTATKKDDVPD
jgi:hypothetical protein